MSTPVTISSLDGETHAEFVPDANMVCCSLRWRDAELLDAGQGLDAYARRGKTMGIPLLYPWANRLAQPSYQVGASAVELPAPDGLYGLDPNGLPIHGALPGTLRWAVRAGSPADRVAAQLDWSAAATPELMTLFPFEHQLVMEATVAGGRLTVETSLRATGTDRVPVSFGFHPYLRLPGASRRRWRVSLGAAHRLVLDERMIPTGQREPLAERDFALAEQSWDDSLDDLDAGGARFTVSDGELTLTVAFEEGFGYAQVYAPPAHDYICFEPMTAPTNALVSGQGLSIVEPGEEYRTRWSVTVTR